MIGDGRLQLTEAAPGSQTWLAQLNANMRQLNDTAGERHFGTFGETVLALQPVALDTDGKFYLADADAANPLLRRAFGFALANTAINVAGVIVVRGPVTAPAAHGVALGSLIYLTNTPGVISTTPLGSPVGMSLTSVVFWVDCPSSW